MYYNLLLFITIMANITCFIALWLSMIIIIPLGLLYE